MADVDQGHDDENCEGDFLISCISERVVPVREMGRRKSKTEVITWVRELTSCTGKVFGDLEI